MPKLVYLALASLDGYIEDTHGNFDWCEPDAEVHSFINDFSRGVGTHLYGRRMYETMVAWETFDLAGQTPHIRDFAEIWRAADKIVFSTSLENAPSTRTRIERTFDADAVRQIKESARSDVSVAGPELAGQAFKAGLVDECLLFLAPVSVGDGKAALPNDVRMNLELLDERRFASGFVHLRYRVLPFRNS